MVFQNTTTNPSRTDRMAANITDIKLGAIPTFIHSQCNTPSLWVARVMLKKLAMVALEQGVSPLFVVRDNRCAKISADFCRLEIPRLEVRSYHQFISEIQRSRNDNAIVVIDTHWGQHSAILGAAISSLFHRWLELTAQNLPFRAAVVTLSPGVKPRWSPDVVKLCFGADTDYFPNTMGKTPNLSQVAEDDRAIIQP